VAALFAGQIDTEQGMNRAQLLESLIASGDVTDAAQQTVDGVKTTHYTGTLDPATAYKIAAPPASEVEDISILASMMPTNT
jgi:hypothetical protein